IYNPHTSTIYFYFKQNSTTKIYTLSLHDALPIYNKKPSLPNNLEIAEFQNKQKTIHDILKDERILNNKLQKYRDIPTKRLINMRSEEHTSELQSRFDLVCRLLLEKKNYINVRETC